jgi:hypothetical protein
MSGSISDDASIGQPKFEWKCGVGLRGRVAVERVEQTPCLVVASGKNRGCVRYVGPKSILPSGMVQQGDSIALSAEVIGRRQPGQAGAQNEDSL